MHRGHFNQRLVLAFIATPQHGEVDPMPEFPARAVGEKPTHSDGPDRLCSLTDPSCLFGV